MIMVNRLPEKFVGQTLAMNGFLFGTVVGRGEVFELQVFNVNNAKPSNLFFTTSKDIATQLSDLGLGAPRRARDPRASAPRASTARAAHRIRAPRRLVHS